MLFFAAVVLLGLPVDDWVLVDSVDTIELNHVVRYSRESDDIQPVFSQYIFWDRCTCNHEGCRGHRVVAWRDARRFTDAPSKIKGRWNLIFSEDGRLRHVRAAYFRETIRQTTAHLGVPTVTVDPERIDRVVHSGDDRRELTKP